MKNIGLVGIVLIALSVYSAKGQIQFEKSFAYSTSTTQLEVDGYKIFLMDVAGEQCRLYNPDYSLWKTVDIAIPNNRFLTDIKFVSQHVFNQDDLIEMLVIYYQYVEVGNSYYYIYTTQVINENGTVLITEPGGAYAELKATSESGSKLFLYIYDYSSFPYSVETKVFGVPGVLLGLADDDILTSSAAEKAFNLFPNPSDGRVNIRANQGAFARDAWLIIRDEFGTLRSKTMLQQGSAEENLDLIDLPSGIYLYEVITPFYRSKPARFVKI